MSCGQKWRAWGDTAKSIHDLENDHLKNILKYLEVKRIQAYILGETHNERRLKDQLDIMCEEAKRRGMRPGALLKKLGHPDPYEVAKKKKLVPTNEKI